MSSEPNLSRINDYQNHIEELHRSKIRLEKSISDVANKKKINDAGGDNDSINSVESLNNYLDVKVRVIQFFLVVSPVQTLSSFIIKILY
jgi:hypothetical protein